MKNEHTYLVACAGIQAYIINAESKEKAITEANKASYYFYGVELQHPTAYLIKDYVEDSVLDVSKMLKISGYEMKMLNRNY